MLWQPDETRRRQTQLWRFAEQTHGLHGCAPGDYFGLHAWSVRDRGGFWNAVWDFAEVIGDKGAGRLLHGDAMPGAQFFADARLNYAENLLRRTGDAPAIVGRLEDGTTSRWSWDALHATVSQLQQALGALGIGPGDRVAGMLPNVPEAIALMLATASIGAVWSSCSPDFGSRGVLDRFNQISPKLFIAADGYRYNGRSFDIGETVRAVAAELGTNIVILDQLGGGEALARSIDGALTLAEFAGNKPVRPVQFTRLPFAHPLFILFSSGTTGLPKCIVHSAGGTLLQHLKEHRLHSDIRPGDRILYFTTLGWMMWNWQASALASGATLCLYDGSPGYPDANHLFDIASAERLTLLGLSARFIDVHRKSGLRPADTHDLGELRTMLSTGSPLSAEGFAHVYGAIKRDLHFASISGGTDIVSCFVLGVPTLPVYAGEIQAPGLGMAVDVFDEAGQPLAAGKGELVCRAPFPSMPLGLWNDADGERYRATYFARFPKVWAHGDYAEWTGHHGLIIHGRSDATLNPSGVRIGTAEIYGVVEEFAEIDSALCVGQEWQGDTRIVLFVCLRPGAVLDAALEQRLRQAIRSSASPRHVPARIIAVGELPRTRSGKLVELAVREAIHGRPVRNVETLANPEALEQFRDLEALRS